MPILGPSLELLEAAKLYMANNIDKNISIDDIADHVSMSKFALIRLFRKEGPVTPARFLWNLRVETAAAMIEANPDLQLISIFPRCGFNSPQHFSRFFSKRYGVSPRDYQKGRRS